MALQEQEMSHATSWKHGISRTKSPADDGIVAMNPCVHAHVIVSRGLWEAFVNQGS